MATANLKIIYGGGGGLMRIAAGQTYNGEMGGIVVPFTTVTTPTNMLILNGKYSLRNLYISYLAGAASNLTVVLTIDGRVVLNTIIPLGTSAGSAAIFGGPTSTINSGEVEVNTNLTLSVQRSVADQVSVTANALALV